MRMILSLRQCWGDGYRGCGATEAGQQQIGRELRNSFSANQRCRGGVGRARRLELSLEHRGHGPKDQCRCDLQKNLEFASFTPHHSLQSALASPASATVAARGKKVLLKF